MGAFIGQALLLLYCCFTAASLLLYFKLPVVICGGLDRPLRALVPLQASLPLLTVLCVCVVYSSSKLGK